jgi:hypothetical protein
VCSCGDAGLLRVGVRDSDIFESGAGRDRDY